MNFEDEQVGAKYRVHKLNDPPGKHDRCKYFVLDPEHDVHARDALRTYAIACKDTNPGLAHELIDWLAKYPLMTPYQEKQLAEVKALRLSALRESEFSWDKADAKSHAGHCPARASTNAELCTCMGYTWD